MGGSGQAFDLERFIGRVYPYGFQNDKNNPGERCLVDYLKRFRLAIFNCSCCRVTITMSGVLASPFDGTAFHDLAVVDRETMMKSHSLIYRGSRYVTKLLCEAFTHIKNHRFWVFIEFN